jgi:hypothetical protein
VGDRSQDHPFFYNVYALKREASAMTPAAGAIVSDLIDAPNIPAVNFRITDELNLGLGSETDKSNDDIAAITSLRHRACEPPRHVRSDR